MRPPALAAITYRIRLAIKGRDPHPLFRRAFLVRRDAREIVKGAVGFGRKELRFGRDRLTFVPGVRGGPNA